MKRVRLAAAALPAAGLMLPAMGANAATAVATGPQHDVPRPAKTVSLGHVRPAHPGHLGARIDSANKCIGADCVTVWGSGNEVSSASLQVVHSSRKYQETMYLGYRTTFGSDNDAWKHFTASWKGFEIHKWYPACSLSSGAKVSGYGYWHKSSRPLITIIGNHFTDKHQCWA